MTTLFKIESNVPFVKKKNGANGVGAELRTTLAKLKPGQSFKLAKQYIGTYRTQSRDLAVRTEGQVYRSKSVNKKGDRRVWRVR